jgi:hypothetical protein
MSLYGPDGALGPQFSYADNLKTPSEIGVRSGGSFGAITSAVAGITYYVDAIGFGERGALGRNLGAPQQKPIGLKYFINTKNKCSNGQDMYDYIDTVPKGDMLGAKVGNEIRRTMGVGLKGMAPGMLEDARDSLNPTPFLQIMAGSGYAKCKEVTLPIGDGNLPKYDGKGNLIGPNNEIWASPPIEMKDGIPHQKRWILDSYISADEYNKEKKEKFSNLSDSYNPLVSGFLLAALAIGVAYTVAKK